MDITTLSVTYLNKGYNKVKIFIAKLKNNLNKDVETKQQWAVFQKLQCKMVR